MQSVPVPRIEPADRAIHGATEAEPPAPEPILSPPPQPPPALPAPPAGLARDDLRKLHAALHELAECRKLLDGAVVRTD